MHRTDRFLLAAAGIALALCSSAYAAAPDASGRPNINDMMSHVEQER